MDIQLQSIILKDLIKKSGLTQAKFAEKHGITQANISRVCNQKAEFRSSTLKLVAMDEGYEIELHYLLKPIKSCPTPKTK